MIFVTKERSVSTKFITMNDGTEYKIEKTGVYQLTPTNLWVKLDGPLADEVRNSPSLMKAKKWELDCEMSIEEFNEDYHDGLCGDGSGYYGVRIDGDLYVSHQSAYPGDEPEWATCVMWYNK